MGVAPALRAENLTRRFAAGGETLTVFEGLNLEMATGERVAVVGESGSGKSTLLHLLGALDRPTEGRISVHGRDLASLDDGALALFRNREIGFVWQMNTLLGEFSALENVMMPLLVAGAGPGQAEAQARERLREVGLEGKSATSGAALSGGEQQRAALARALVAGPRILLADEPTGNLDARTAAGIMNLLIGIQERRELTLILVTHNLEFANRCHRILKLESGALHSETPVVPKEKGLSRKPRRG